MYTPTRIAGREAVFEFLRQKLRAYQIIYKDFVCGGNGRKMDGWNLGRSDVCRMRAEQCCSVEQMPQGHNGALVAVGDTTPPKCNLRRSRKTGLRWWNFVESPPATPPCTVALAALGSVAKPRATRPPTRRPSYNAVASILVPFTHPIHPCPCVCAAVS